MGQRITRLYVLGCTSLAMSPLSHGDVLQNPLLVDQSSEIPQ